MKHLIIFFLLTKLCFAIHGKVIFFDGTYVVGQVTKIDDFKVHIIPMGLNTPEGMLLANIDTLRMEDGKIAVLNSSVKYFYQNGIFTENDDDWLDEFNDFKYDQDVSNYKESYKYDGKEKTNQAYYKLSLFGSFAMALGMKDFNDLETGKATNPYIGIGFQAPYIVLGALDVSPGAYIMYYGYDDQYMGKVQAYQMVANGSFDFNPIFFFLPDWFHLCADIGISYNNKISVEPGEELWTDGSGNIDNFGGFGLNFGPSFNFSLGSLPMEFHLFNHVNMVPQNGEWAPKKTAIMNFGANIIVVLKRGRK
tara:strand:+ start:1044 stop:1967 length:924 start_codon:yes stop_codon:yes gene_type:complete